MQFAVLTTAQHNGIPWRTLDRYPVNDGICRQTGLTLPTRTALHKNSQRSETAIPLNGQSEFKGPSASTICTETMNTVEESRASRETDFAKELAPDEPGHNSMSCRCALDAKRAESIRCADVAVSQSSNNRRSVIKRQIIYES